MLIPANSTLEYVALTFLGGTPETKSTELDPSELRKALADAQFHAHIGDYCFKSSFLMAESDPGGTRFVFQINHHTDSEVQFSSRLELGAGEDEPPIADLCEHGLTIVAELSLNGEIIVQDPPARGTAWVN